MSPIRSILLHADAGPRWPERLAWAAGIATAFDADLTTLYAVQSVWVGHPFSLIGSPDAAALLRDVEEQRLAEVRAVYERAVATLGGRLHWAEAGLASPERALTRLAFGADLLVLGQQEPKHEAESGVPVHFIESVVIDSGRPALVVPYIGAPAPIGGTVLVAWKEARESARALSAALPFLQGARRVHIATWTEGEAEGAPAADPVEYLRRHGVEATLRPCGAAPEEVGDAMLSLAVDVSADLLVMGCYGHSRARERVIGGATRRVLESMTLPVLMAH